MQFYFKGRCRTFAFCLNMLNSLRLEELRLAPRDQYWVFLDEELDVGPVSRLFNFESNNCRLVTSHCTCLACCCLGWCITCPLYFFTLLSKCDFREHTPTWTSFNVEVRPHLCEEDYNIGFFSPELVWSRTLHVNCADALRLTLCAVPFTMTETEGYVSLYPTFFPSMHMTKCTLRNDFRLLEHVRLRLEPLLLATSPVMPTALVDLILDYVGVKVNTLIGSAHVNFPQSMEMY